MAPIIRISEPTADKGEVPSRLNLYPGRYLSEREFELLQAYVDKRIAPLAAGMPAGIISGMEIRHENNDGNTVLQFQPGIALGVGNRLVRLFYPLGQKWPELVEAVERQQDKPLDDGIYFITLQDVVEEIDKGDNQEPCTRTEPDPTRERRLETVILPGLRFISANPRLMAMPQPQAANRICVRFLNESPFDPEIHDIPVALVKVVGKKPEWIDTVAGRYISEPDSPYRTLLAHTIAYLEQWMEQKNWKDPEASLATLLGLDYLPAAAPLPPMLLQHAASDNPEEMLQFQPADLQVELLPVPASTVGSIIDRELPRGTVDLVHGLGDRIRLLLAIPDIDYRPDLMNLPERDTKLEDELFHRGAAAATAWSEWWIQWQLLFGGLTEEQCQLNKAPNYLLGAAEPPESGRPIDPDEFRNSLVTEREVVGETLPEPYRSHKEAPHVVEGYQEVDSPEALPDRLIQQRKTLQDEIDNLKQKLDESFSLLNEMNDYLNQQRQGLDSLTISFSALAGGVAGDGSGSSMIRWVGNAAFEPKTGA